MPAERTPGTQKVKKIQAYACRYQDCEKTFGRPYDLQRHEKIHRGYDERDFACSVEGCQFRANQRAGIKVHEDSVHKGIRLLCKSPGCDKTFSDPSSRTKHNQRFHSVDTELASEPVASTSTTPQLVQTPQGYQLDLPEHATQPFSQYVSFLSRAMDDGSPGPAVRIQIVPYVEPHTAGSVPDALSQFAAFALQQDAIKANFNASQLSGGNSGTPSRIIDCPPIASTFSAVPSSSVFQSRSTSSRSTPTYTPPSPSWEPSSSRLVNTAPTDLSYAHPINTGQRTGKMRSTVYTAQQLGPQDNGLNSDHPMTANRSELPMESTSCQQSCYPTYDGAQVKAVNSNNDTLVHDSDKQHIGSNETQNDSDQLEADMEFLQSPGFNVEAVLAIILDCPTAQIPNL